MVKNKMKNRGWANDVSIIHKGRGNTKRKNPHRTLQCTKMGQCKKKILMSGSFLPVLSKE
jgi:hypothetical protein